MMESFIIGRYEVTFRIVRPLSFENEFGEQELAFDLIPLKFSCYKGGYFPEQWGISLILFNFYFGLHRLPD